MAVSVRSEAPYSQVPAVAVVVLGIVVAAMVLVSIQLSLQNEGSSLLPGLWLPFGSVFVIGLTGLAMIGLVWWSFRQQATSIQAAADAQQRRNDQAIQLLIDEIGALAQGDLTIEATVTEDFTGAIADSVNYTVEALRDLAATINSTAERVASASRDSLTTAEDLVAASRTQTEQIISATEAIEVMVRSLQQVSRTAAQAADVTGRSVQVANTGGDAVRRTINGMDATREQIQETSKRIKRLGESSQEIGDIVELINDISEQTNTLALNASIQAAVAGEAGRGFAVVADEVQRLAERSGNATKQIEALVRTIQNDTNEAIISMEKSTAGVVGGAKLAENAGQALEEIEQVSQQIATLVGEIASAAERQTEQASTVSGTMGEIRAITERTERGTRETGNAIGNLAQLAVRLRESVSGFKLPE